MNETILIKMDSEKKRSDSGFPKALRASAFLFCILLLCLLMSCLRQERQKGSPVRFALLGNTRPESAFQWEEARLKKVLEDAGRANPLFIIHTGDMICGGREWMGIRPSDMRTQFRAFFRAMGSVEAIIYPIAGDMDLLDGKIDEFAVATGRKGPYSFNYGSLHFIVLNRGEGGWKKASEEDRKWLRNDLKESRASSGIIVLSHYVLFKTQTSKNGSIAAPLFPELHEEMRKYPVRTVICGDGDSYFQGDCDGIQYINAGCGGYRAGDQVWRVNQYYIVDFNGDSISIDPRRVQFDR
jgi:hypothetical protein